MRQPRFRLLYPIVLLTLYSACGSDSDSGTEPLPPEPGPADLRAFFSRLPSWTALSPQLAAAEEAAGETASEPEPRMIDGSPYVCSATPYSLTRTPDAIVTMNPDVEVLWLGSLLQGDGHLRGIGSLAELPVRQRAPLTVTLDLLAGANTQVVENPTAATVNQAVGTLIQAASDAGHRAGSNIFYTSETAHSVTQAALKLGLSASYMGSTVKTSLGADLSNETRTVTAYFVQRMFTASMVLPQHPEEVFSEAFTDDMLAREVSSGRMDSSNPPVFISSKEPAGSGPVLVEALDQIGTDRRVDLGYDLRRTLRRQPLE